LGFQRRRPPVPELRAAETAVDQGRRVPPPDTAEHADGDGARIGEAMVGDVTRRAGDQPVVGEDRIKKEPPAERHLRGRDRIVERHGHVERGERLGRAHRQDLQGRPWILQR
jgi:hypothetical protein